jgi:integrase
LFAAEGTLPQPDGTRKRQTFYARTAAAADAKLAAAKAAAGQGLPTRSARQPLGQYLRWWLEHVQRPRVAPSTYEHQEMLVRRHLGPDLGTVPLATLSAQQLAAFYGRKRRAGYAPGTIQGMHALLSAALAAAVRWELVPRNVAQLARQDVPTGPRAEPRVLDVEPAQRFLTAARGERLEGLYMVALYCGLRRGELAGLRWQDVDLEGAQLHVRQKAIRVHRRLVEDAPKGKRARTLDLPASVVAALRAHRTRQAVERLAAPSWARPDLVFTTPLGEPLNPASLNTNHIKRVLRRAGLEGLSAHSLRHSFVSLALREGIDVAIVSQMAGHASPDITLRVYRHVLGGERKGAAERLAKLLDAPPEATMEDELL